MFTLLNTDVASDVLANFNLKSIDRNKYVKKRVTACKGVMSLNRA